MASTAYSARVARRQLLSSSALRAGRCRAGEAKRAPSVAGRRPRCRHHDRVGCSGRGPAHPAHVRPADTFCIGAEACLRAGNSRTNAGLVEHEGWTDRLSSGSCLRLAACQQHVRRPASRSGFRRWQMAIVVAMFSAFDRNQLLIAMMATIDGVRRCRDRAAGGSSVVGAVVGRSSSRVRAGSHRR